MATKPTLVFAAGMFVLTAVLFAAAMVIAHALSIPDPAKRFLPSVVQDLPEGPASEQPDHVTLATDVLPGAARTRDEPVATVTAVPASPPSTSAASSSFSSFVFRFLGGDTSAPGSSTAGADAAAAGQQQAPADAEASLEKPLSEGWTFEPNDEPQPSDSPSPEPSPSPSATDMPTAARPEPSPPASRPTHEPSTWRPSTIPARDTDDSPTAQ